MSNSKHFCNDPGQLVTASLRSITILNPTTCLDPENKVIYLAQLDSESQQKKDVSIISGGGSGHEPSFGAFVGPGLLTASVAGSIFASPNSRQILSVIHRAAKSKNAEVLVTVMNYTGDVLNFGVAVEAFKAQRPDVKVEMLVVGDDVAVPRSRFGKVGRRGMAGTVLVHKITGALSSLGYGLRTVANIGRLVADNLVTIGIALDRVHVPGRIEDEASLGPDEVEIGMGIHNEPGCARVQGPEAQLPALVKESLRQLLSQDDEERAFVKTWNGASVLLVNNLGGLSALELGAAVTETVEQLEANYRIVPERVYSGTFMTSLDCRGFSLTLLNNVPLGIPHDVFSLLDQPSQATGWIPTMAKGWRSRVASATKESVLEEADSGAAVQRPVTNLVGDMNRISAVLRQGLKSVIASEPEVTKFDSIVGDGDCGTTLKRGAEGILAVLSGESNNIIELLSSISISIEQNMDGTSGAIYSIYINALRQNIQAKAEETVPVDAQFWSQSLTAALAVLSNYTPARPGDRTLIDALVPFVETLGKTLDVSQAARAAIVGAESTRHMRARLGRTVYVGNESDWVGVIPDPGAWGLSKFFAGIAGAFT